MRAGRIGIEQAALKPMSPSPINQKTKAKTPPACPICGRPRAEAHRPFCSRRCADVDLHRWLHGSYTIAGEEDSEDDRKEAAAEDE